VQLAVDGVELVAQPQAHVGSHLVVARAAGVQFLADLADAQGQGGFDVHVHVFERHLPFEAAGVDVSTDAFQTSDDGRDFRVAQNLHPAQHPRVGDGTHNVMTGQTPIETDRSGETLDKGVSGFGETAAPGFAGCCGHGREGQAWRSWEL
jgi:hypothetical protein